MKYFPLKVLVLSVLLPPVLYILSLQALESMLRVRLQNVLEVVYIGETDSLFSGRVALKEAVNANVDNFLSGNFWVDVMGVRANVLVVTKGGTLLYPVSFNGLSAESTGGHHPDPSVVGSENFRLLNEGIVLTVDVDLAHNTLLSNLVLSAYMLTSLLVLLYVYRKGDLNSRRDEQEKGNRIDRLIVRQREYQNRLEELFDVREKLAGELSSLKTKYEREREKASLNEDEMISDIVALEGRLDQNLSLQNRQEEEIQGLTEKLRRYERKTGGRQKHGGLDAIEKRFKALYKNVDISRRAIDGYQNLTEELKIKGEEVIHQLNEDSSLVTVKRKVFGKKNRETVFEVLFAYKGRLYFGKNKDARVLIHAVGTKNTQSKDLEYLDSL